jgi:DNA polymerase elongation subunit (family B)
LKPFYTHISIRGNSILHRGYDNYGKRIHEKVSYNPTLFVPSKSGKGEWTTLDGRVVEPFQPGDIKECRDFVEQYRDVSGFEIFGNTEYIYQYIGDEFKGEIEYDPSLLRVGYIDIETESEEGFPNIETANERVNAITIKLREKTFVFGLGQFSIADENVKCFCYEDEERMLKDFIAAWQTLDLDIVTGWNVNFFDIPYLVNRITRLFGEKEALRLSPWGMVKSRIVEVMERKNEVYDLIGISILDYFDLYRKFTYVTQASYKLDHIAFVELGDRKIAYDGSLSDFYQNDFQRFVEYNIHDVNLVEKLEQKLKLMELALALAYTAKVNLNDVFSQVRTWDAIIYHELCKDKVAIPMKRGGLEKEDKFEGAYVKEPLVGRHEWVVSFDLDSLYPHLMMQYNLSPETKTSDGKRNAFPVIDFLAGAPVGTPVCAYLEKMKDKDLSVAANCVTFRRDMIGVLPRLMETMYQERKMFKGKLLETKRALKSLGDDADPDEVARLKNDISKYHNFQLVRKIQLNSAFGACGNEYFRYYDEEIAEAITVSGQLSIRWIEKHLNEFLNKSLKTKNMDFIIASDTDSVYLRLGKLVQQVMPNETDKQKITKFLDKFCNDVIQPFINKKYDELALQQNAYSQKMHMKREAIASQGIWTAKKRYMLNVYMGEENVLLSEPDMKIMGIETSRSSTPQVIRDSLKKCIHIIMNGTEEELINYVADFRDKFRNLPVQDAASPRSVKKMSKYKDTTFIYRKSTPIHVKGSLIFNHLLKDKGLAKKYQPIIEGDKIKFIPLKVPNPIHQAVIAFPNTIPSEFALGKYIDYDAQFETNFVNPLLKIINCIGWKMEKTSSLEDLFA